jgi:hypothetical protein
MMRIRRVRSREGLPAQMIFFERGEKALSTGGGILRKGAEAVLCRLLVFPNKTAHLKITRRPTEMRA